MLESQLEKWAARHADTSIPVALVLPSGRRMELSDAPKVTITIKELGAVRHVLRPTLASLGTGYVEGRIDIDGKIDDILDVAVALSRLSGGENFEPGGQSWLDRVRRHTRSRDREAIQYHYDVSNEFYQLFLDTNLVYSCGYFRPHDDGADDTLDQAQTNKLDHILTKLQVKPGDTFLDVGSGWGALIIRAAQRGAKCVGVTLSRNQYDYSVERIASLGLSDRCEVRLQDYRDVPEVNGYDKIASVGMFEHVGDKNLPGYFEKMHSLLKDGGAMLMHGITSTYPENPGVGRSGSEFLTKYVFPEAELPHVSFVMRTLAQANFEAVDAESLRRHYARTLNHWIARLEGNADQARALAGEKRYRIWRVYLAGCAYGFAENWMNLYQILCCKLGPGMNPFPMTRDWMYR